MIGRSIGPFRLVEQLGEGTLGTVYHAVDQSANRDAALEILRPEYSQNADLNSRLQSDLRRAPF
jgi:serine/threonine protein kinase